jgi:hypothetical protein
VSETAKQGPVPARRSRWSSILRVAFEFGLLFGIAVLARQLLVAASAGSYPNPLWLPVIVLSLQHGLAAGLAAAIIAAGMQYWDGLPPALMSEDMYAYVARVAAEPMGWTCAALLIGHIRSRQIANHAQLETELAEQARQSAAVAELCIDLRARTEMLERHIAAAARVSDIDVAEAVSELSRAGFDDLAQRLTRFMIVLTGAAEFSVYALRDDELKPAFQSRDDHRQAVPVMRDDPVHAAIVAERRTLSSARPADAALLGDRWDLAGPLLDGSAPDRVIGMLAIAGVSPADQPEDIERRFALAASEIARLVGRIAVLDCWQAAAAPTRSNGHAAEPAGTAAVETGEPDEPAAAAAPAAESVPVQTIRPVLPDNEFTLQ